MRRYQRQILLNEVGIRGQRAIADAKVLIVGAGGLGSPAALYLASAGVGSISVIDGDVVSESNLHRQIMFTSNDIGHNKALVLAEGLGARATGKITGLPHHLDRTSALALFPEFDLILDATDNFAAKYLINDVAVLYKRPVVYGAISHFEGRISIFAGGRSNPCYRCLFPKPPQSRIENCAEAGVLGPLPGIIGTLQAMEALKWILHYKAQSPVTPLEGRILIHSLADNTVEMIPAIKRAGCICAADSLNATDLAHHDDALSCSRPSSLANCIEDELKGRTVIDVRSREEWEDYHLPDSVHWPMERWHAGEFPVIDEGQSYILVCKSGGRARRALELLTESSELAGQNVKAFSGSIYEAPLS